MYWVSKESAQYSNEELHCLHKHSVVQMVISIKKIHPLLDNCNTCANGTVPCLDVERTFHCMNLFVLFLDCTFLHFLWFLIAPSKDTTSFFLPLTHLPAVEISHSSPQYMPSGGSEATLKKNSNLTAALMFSCSAYKCVQLEIIIICSWLYNEPSC